MVDCRCDSFRWSVLLCSVTHYHVLDTEPLGKLLILEAQIGDSVLLLDLSQ